METVSKIKERPILFSAPMVRGVLSGQKSSVRRPVKFPMIDRDFGCELAGNEIGQSEAHRLCPYGQPGDRLWIREPFGEVYEYCDHPEMPGAPTEYWHIDWKYRADGETPDIEDGVFTGWKPNIHMPRDACRILLEITGVRVERLRNSDDLVLLDELGDMLEDCDSVAGREFSRIEHLQCAGAPLRMLPEMYGFLAWWDKTNGHGSFDSNPWVWVVEFKRVTP